MTLESFQVPKPLVVALWRLLNGSSAAAPQWLVGGISAAKNELRTMILEIMIYKAFGEPDSSNNCQVIISE